MAAVRGSELLIKRGDGASPEVFTTIGAIRNSRVTFDGNPIDVTTADDVDGNNEIWRTQITGVKSLAVSGDGIGKQLQPIQSMYSDFALGTISNYQVVIPYIGTFTVAMVITNMTFDGSYDGASTFSIEIASASAPTFVAEV